MLNAFSRDKHTFQKGSAMLFSQTRKTRKRKNANSSNQFQKLEDRNLLAAISFNGTTGQLYIAGGF